VEALPFEAPVDGRTPAPLVALATLSFAGEDDAGALLHVARLRVAAMASHVDAQDGDVGALIAFAAGGRRPATERDALDGWSAVLAALDEPPSPRTRSGRARLWTVARELLHEADGLRARELRVQAEWLTRLVVLERAFGHRRAPVGPPPDDVVEPFARPPVVLLRRLAGGESLACDRAWEELELEVEAHARAAGLQLVRDGEADVAVDVRLDGDVCAVEWAAWLHAGDEPIDLRARHADALARVRTSLGVGQRLARVIAVEARRAASRAVSAGAPCPRPRGSTGR
jgi:hypothetical protein